MQALLYHSFLILHTVDLPRGQGSKIEDVKAGRRTCDSEIPRFIANLAFIVPTFWLSK